VETFEQRKNTRMLVTPKGKWDYSAYQAGNLFTLEVRSLEGRNRMVRTSLSTAARNYP